MLQAIPDLLDASELAHFRTRLADAEWEDGRRTAGHQAREVKRNLQLTEAHPLAQELGGAILRKLAQSSLFTSFALPLKVFPPLFNRYEGGGHFGAHVDTAVRYVNQAPYRVRTDLSATLFLCAPEEYEGGELSIEDTYATHRVKLPAGHLLVYPASSRHEVTPVTRGTRLAAFFWVQSMVRSDAQRALLFELDGGIQKLGAELPGHAALVQLTGVYHNLLRQWAEL